MFFSFYSELLMLGQNGEPLAMKNQLVIHRVLVLLR